MSLTMDGIFYVPLVVYRNLHHLLRYRKLELVNGSFITATSAKAKKREMLDALPLDSESESESTETPETPRTPKTPGLKKSKYKMVQGWLDDLSFIELIQWERYCIVEARDLDTKVRKYPKHYKYNQAAKTKTFIIILDQGYEVNSADLTKILGKLPEIKSSTRKFNTDILIISENYLTIHAAKKLSQFVTPGDETAGYISAINELYPIFMSDPFERKSTSKHRILDVDEEKKALLQIRATKQSLQKIAPLDPICIILGAITGDMLEISAFNENTGTCILYVIVK